MKSLMLSTAVIAAAVSASPADAALLQFTLTGSRNASFTLDSEQNPDFSNAIQTRFSTVSGVFNGVLTTALVQFQRTGFEIIAPQSTGLGFSQFTSNLPLFSGPTNDPTLLTGTFSLSSIVSGSSTLVVSPAAAVPEPATWAMMIGGFGLVGAAMRRRAKVAVALA